MIFLILTKNGYKEIEALIHPAKTILWINANILTSEELQVLRSSGVEITNFEYCIDPNNSEQILDAIHTISEHHPCKSIWAENRIEP